MIKYGIKLWTIDKHCFSKTVKLYQDGLIDFVELYFVPDEIFKNDLDILKDLPVYIHAPHSYHNFNIFDLDTKKINLFKNQVVELANFFNSDYIILHAGTGDDPKIFKKNIAKIYDKRIIIENMPKIGKDGSTCFGYSLEQLKFIKKECRLNLCLDLAHTIKSAVSQNLNYKNFIKSLIFNLKPEYFHISGGEKTNEKDDHLDLFGGDFDIPWVKETLSSLSKNKTLYLVFEVPKTKELENDIKNINYFKGKL